MKNKFHITASIVLFKNDKVELDRAIKSFLNTDLNVHLYLVDNSPNDDLSILKTCDKISYHYTGKNLGFGSAHNIVLKEINELSKYHLILNPDVFFKKGVLEELYKYMDSEKGVGLVMPRILYPDGTNQPLCKLLPSPVELIFRKFIPIKVLVKKINDRYQLAGADYNSIMDVPSLSGCFMFIRTSIFEKIGYFDERFFMYCEDLDYSRRINQVYRTVYFPYVSVYHEFHRDSYKNKALLKAHVFSALKYFNKWGWIFDKIRRKTNFETLKHLGLN